VSTLKKLTQTTDHFSSWLTCFILARK
jgi:hypothetical protein